MQMKFSPTLASLHEHPVPEWFKHAKFGIMVSWGLYSIPGWAVPCGPLPEIIAKKGYRYLYRNNPYAEFYWNTLKINDSPTYRYHLQAYGEPFQYPDFASRFNTAAEAWSPGSWADCFVQAGARYVVLVTKHHDGFLMWPSRSPNPYRPDFCTRRDVVGELTDAVRGRGLRMGLYYSGGIDWWFEPRRIENEIDFLAAVPQSAEYVQYVNRHYRELIERYQPAILWNDIGFPAELDVKALYADYYNQIPDGVVNDRSLQADIRRWTGNPFGRALLRFLLKQTLKSLASDKDLDSLHADFRTPEYQTLRKQVKYKWETTRGLGYSFGYNQNETAEHMLTVEQLVFMLADVVSKNGNLLLCVGPRADGTIPDLQQERLLGLGKWLDVNGEANYNTHPWLESEGKTADGAPIRFTAKDDCLYAIILGTPQNHPVNIPGLRLKQGTTIHLLGHAPALNTTLSGEKEMILLPGLSRSSPAYVLKFSPSPDKNG